MPFIVVAASDLLFREAVGLFDFPRFTSREGTRTALALVHRSEQNERDSSTGACGGWNQVHFHQSRVPAPQGDYLRARKQRGNMPSDRIARHWPSRPATACASQSQFLAEKPAHRPCRRRSAGGSST